MIIEVKLVGGLGNQLFQYAAARSLAINKQVGEIWINIESYKSDPFGRSCGLLNFKISGSVIQNKIIYNILRKNSRLNKMISAFPFYRVIEEKKLAYQHMNHRLGFLTTVSGYWQSESYFKDIRQVLIKELVPHNTPALPYWIKYPETVAVHIRRTDYLREKQFGFLGEAYYREAFQEMKKNLKNPLFVLFSDDVEWCKTTFKSGESLQFVDETVWKEDYLQLWLMSKCKHQIIANSSFSWWAGWLNENTEKIVIRPAVPFADSSLMHASYYPTHWVSIENCHEFN